MSADAPTPAGQDFAELLSRAVMRRELTLDSTAAGCALPGAPCPRPR